MYRSGRYSSWIDAGYDLFSIEGQDGIQVERLARVLGLNKSGFYHYFGDRETYFEHLMRHHSHLGTTFIKTAATLDSYDPGFIQLMVDNKSFVMFNRQLLRNRHEAIFLKTHDELQGRLDPVIGPLWAKSLGLDAESTIARRYFEIVRDVLNSRLDNENLTYPFLHGVVAEALGVFNEIRKSTIAAPDAARSARDQVS